MSDERVPRHRAREAMKTCKLPEGRPERIWGGPGSGAMCAVCGQIVGKEETEFELQFGSNGGSDTVTYPVHAQMGASL